MAHSCFAERLSEMTALTPAEHRALEHLETRERQLRRGTTLVRQHDRTGDLFIVRRGRLMSSILLQDGGRQILRFLFPGDMVAMSGLVYREASETITALTGAVVSPFDTAAMGALIDAHPRLAALILVYNQIERTALSDRLAAIGRASAKARVATVLIDIRDRVRAPGAASDSGFVLGLTQEEIGDATGLTAVHVNRMLRQMEDEQLIARTSGLMTFTDEKALLHAANHVDRYAGLNLGWLPKSR